MQQHQMYPETLVSLEEFVEALIRLSKYVMHKEKQFIPTRHSGNTVEAFFKAVHQQFLKARERERLEKEAKEIKVTMFDGMKDMFSGVK